MIFKPNRRTAALSLVIFGLLGALLVSPLTNASCSTLVEPGSEAARRQLQQLARTDALTDDALVRIEQSNANTFVAALARLARANNRLSSNDANGAIALLDSAIMRLIKASTAIDDYAQLVRAEALAKAARHTEARAAFEALAREYPASLQADTATLRAAEIAFNSNAQAAVPLFLKNLTAKNDSRALLLTARAYEAMNDAPRAAETYRRLYFFAPASDEANIAARKLNPENANLQSAAFLINATQAELIGRAEKLYDAKNYAAANQTYALAFARFPATATPENQLKRGVAALNAKRNDDAIAAFRLIPGSSNVHADALYNLTLALARTGLWDLARTTASEMRRLYPKNVLTAQALSNAGFEAKAKGYFVGANEFFQLAVAAFPNSAETANAQFELAWAAHDRKDFQTSSRLLIEHLANYADKNTDNRGRAGYWAARDSQLAGKMGEADTLYEAMLKRYDANWYGYLAKQRLDEMQRAGLRRKYAVTTPSDVLTRAAANLEPIFIAKENALASSEQIIVKAKQLATINLDDYAFGELNQVSKQAPDSPRINLALAELHQLRFEMVEAFSALRRSFPDYSQMKPEELTREEWTIFYPLNHWNIIKREAVNKSLDAYNVAGLIRQESVYNPRAKSPANAYGLMQLLLPTAQATARREGVGRAINVSSLYEPALNIQLGTAYLRQQMDNFGRLEYVAAAYNAGPGRAVRWRAELPLQIDEWAEAIPFKETRGYVQGIIRNSLQYKRLYDEAGNFRANVGTQAARRDNADTRARRATSNQPDEDE